MTQEQILTEIKALEDKLEQQKREMILTDGALQAFRYILASDRRQEPQPPVEEEVV